MSELVTDEFQTEPLHLGELPGVQAVLPIIKSVRGKDGRIEVIGLASDCSADLEGEHVEAERNPACIETINAGHAVFDLDHRSVKEGKPMIGRPTEARFISNEEAHKMFPGYKFEGRPILVKGYINALGTNPPEDLQTVHHYQEAGEKLFMSIWDPTPLSRGVTLRDGKHKRVAIPGNILRIAITPQSVNKNTPCILAKSVSATLGALHQQNGSAQVLTERFEENAPRLILVGAGLEKALTSNSNVAVSGTPGGESLKMESLLGTVGNAELTTDAEKKRVRDRKCLNCKRRVPAGQKKCARCGEIFKSLGALLGELPQILCNTDLGK